jgi:hypothetical protein
LDFAIESCLRPGTRFYVKYQAWKQGYALRRRAYPPPSPLSSSSSSNVRSRDHCQLRLIISLFVAVFVAAVGRGACGKGRRRGAVLSI